MEERRRIWNLVLKAEDIKKRSPEEEVLIRRYFPTHGIKSFLTDLSRGFSEEHEDALRSMCVEQKLTFAPEIWLRSTDGPERRERSPHIAFVGEPFKTAEEFYDRLSALYSSARNYICVRVGGIYSRNRTGFVYDNDGLAEHPADESMRMPYLRVFWERLGDMSLRGESLHIVKTIDRLTELWASLEYLRARQLLDGNPVSLAPVMPHNAIADLPAIGVRVVGGVKTLLSLPARPQEQSRYSSWIESETLANFAVDYAMRVKEVSRPLANETPPGLKRIIEAAYEQLLPTDPAKNPPSGNYGVLDTFAKVERVKGRMVEWALRDHWLPVIA